MLDSRPLILVLAAVTLAGTSPQRDSRPAPTKRSASEPGTTTPDKPCEKRKDGKEKEKKRTVPANSLIEVWYRSGGQPGKLRPGASALARSIWQRPTRARHMVGTGPVGARALPVHTPRPQPVQPHAPPAAH